MRKLSPIILVGVLFLAASMRVVFAKGPAEEIRISGPGLSQPVVITDPQALDQFIPWSEVFFDKGLEVRQEAPAAERLYQVEFYIKEHDRLRLIYVFQYGPGEPGWIYLPGRGEQWYHTNVGTILRDHLDGRWVKASSDWDGLMRQVLKENAPEDRLLAGKAAAIVWPGLGAAVVLVGALAWRRRRR